MKWTECVGKILKIAFGSSNVHVMSLSMSSVQRTERGSWSICLTFGTGFKFQNFWIHLLEFSVLHYYSPGFISVYCTLCIYQCMFIFNRCRIAKWKRIIIPCFHKTGIEDKFSSKILYFVHNGLRSFSGSATSGDVVFVYSSSFKYSITSCFIKIPKYICFFSKRFVGCSHVCMHFPDTRSWISSTILSILVKTAG